MDNLLVRAAKHVFCYPQIAIWSLMAVAAAIMGPFNTYAIFGWLPRSLYWFLIGGSSVFVAFVLRHFIGQFVRDELSPLFDALNILALTVVLSPIVYGLTLLVPHRLDQMPPGLIQIGLSVFAISLVLFALRRVQRQLPEFAKNSSGAMHFSHQAVAKTPKRSGGTAAVAGSETTVERATPQSCRLRERLPKDQEAPILRLSARDHFVEVDTGEAQHCLRMRFADAIAEMDGVEGFSTHRSHWVARSAIKDVLRQDGKIVLKISNGATVPVSRTYRPNLEKAGIL